MTMREMLRRHPIVIRKMYEAYMAAVVTITLVLILMGKIG